MDRIDRLGSEPRAGCLILSWRGVHKHKEKADMLRERQSREAAKLKAKCRR